MSFELNAFEETRENKHENTWPDLTVAWENKHVARPRGWLGEQTLGQTSQLADQKNVLIPQV